MSFHRSGGVMEFGASLTQPIFEGGRIKPNVRFTEAQREQFLLAYQQTIQGAFRDVSNGLIAYRKKREFRIQQEQLLKSAQDAARLSQVRFKAGTTDTWRCSPTKQIPLPQSSDSHRLEAMNSLHWFSSTRHSVADGCNEHA